MSRIKVTNLRHESATSDNISLDSSGNVSASGNLSVTGTTTFTDDLNVDSGSLFVDASANQVGIGTDAPDSPVHIKGTAQMFPRVETTSTTNDAGWKIKNGTREWSTFVNGTDGAYRIYDETATSERVRITNNGSFCIMSTDATMNTFGTIFTPASNTSTQPAVLNFSKTHSGAIDAVVFRYNGSRKGSIRFDDSSTSFNTSSDYRLKENVVNLDGAIDRVKQLAPKRFNFIVDPNKTVDGFLAHEAQAVVPEAVTGTHNEVDDDGNAVMQGIDQSKLVPLLTAALQEAIGKIETLEAANTAKDTTIAALDARLAALEA